LYLSSLLHPVFAAQNGKPVFWSLTPANFTPAAKAHEARRSTDHSDLWHSRFRDEPAGRFPW